MDVLKFTAAIKKADTGFNSAFNATRAAAEILVEEHNPSEPAKTEYARLIKLGKKLVNDKAIALKHEADVWKYLGANLLIAMTPTYQVELKRKGGNILKPAEDLTTVRERREAAKQIRQASGLSDGRANARGKKVAKPVKVDKKAGQAVDMLPSIASMLSNKDTREAIFQLIVDAGFTKPRKKAAK